MTEIKGTIDFSITKGDGDKFEISYSQNLDNDIAILAMSQYVVGQIFEPHFKELKTKAEGKKLKVINEMISKVSKARMGLTSLVSYAMASKEQWDAAKEQMKAEMESKRAEPTEEKA